MELQEFRILLEKYKAFRELPEQYRTDKFCKLYYKMYSYIISIPKEKIVQKCILTNYIRYGLLGYISHFIEAKDFYNWRNRIYSLMTEKIGKADYKRYQLYYNSKAKEFFDKSNNHRIEKCTKAWNSKPQEEKEQILKTREQTNIKLFGTKTASQNEECKAKMKKAWQNEEKKKQHLDNIKKGVEKKYGPGITNVFQAKEIKEKCIAKHIENLGVEHPAQSKEVQDKMKATCLAKYGREHVGGWFNLSPYSKFGDEVCTAIDNLLGNPEDSIYYAKSGKEYCISSNDKNYYIDMVIPSLGLAFEADGVYYHGLIEGQVDVKGTPVEEIHKRDQEKTIAIEKAGYKLFRIREDEYKSNKSKCLENLLKEIKNYVHSLENRI